MSDHKHWMKKPKVILAADCEFLSRERDTLDKANKQKDRELDSLRRTVAQLLAKQGCLIDANKAMGDAITSLRAGVGI